MKYSERIFKKSFTDIIAKDAYLSACEWLARNVINKRDVLGEVTFSIERDKKQEKPTFILSIYSTLDEKEVNEHNCKVCKEVHKLFYVNEEYNCNSCREQAYRNRMQERIRAKSLYIKKILKRDDNDDNNE